MPDTRITTEPATARRTPAKLPRLCAHLGYQFAERPLPERFAAAAASGFAAVEHPAPYEVAASAVRAKLDELSLTYVQLALPMGNRAAGDKGIGCHPGRDAERRDGLERAIAYATTVGARWIHPMAGAVPVGVDREAALDVYVDTLRRTADAAASADLRVLVEFINATDVPRYLIDSPEAALHAIARCGRDNVCMLVDSHHFAVVGADLAAFVRRHPDRIGHVQIADHPGRHEPGTGRLDFDALFDSLDAVGYDGWVGCEYQPAGITEAGLRWRDRFRSDRGQERR